MNGPQDAGGMMGFGPVVPEPVTPVFHSDWERRAFAITLAMGMTGSWNIDISRHARERIPPAEYWAASYYEIWLKGLERLLAETGLASAEEIAAGRSKTAARPGTRVAAAGRVPGHLAPGPQQEQRQGVLARVQSAGARTPHTHLDVVDHAVVRLGARADAPSPDRPLVAAQSRPPGRHGQRLRRGHRFGADSKNLFGRLRLRAGLEKHPFGA